MDLAAFLQAVTGLVFVPEAERSRAGTVAQRLPDADRLELLRYLQDVNGQLQRELKEDAATLDQAESDITAIEHAFVHLQRQGQESKEQGQDLQRAEQQLSSQH